MAEVTKAELPLELPVLRCMEDRYQPSLTGLQCCCKVCCSTGRWYLFQYRLQGSAAFAAPCVWHNAEGAHVIAAPHDGQVCADAACWPDRENISIGFLCAELHVHGALMFATTSACTALQHDSTIGNYHQLFLQAPHLALCSACAHAPVLSTYTSAFTADCQMLKVLHRTRLTRLPQWCPVT